MSSQAELKAQRKKASSSLIVPSGSSGGRGEREVVGRPEWRLLSIVPVALGSLAARLGAHEAAEFLAASECSVRISFVCGCLYLFRGMRSPFADRQWQIDSEWLTTSVWLS